jgi:hypothetical protein
MRIFKQFEMKSKRFKIPVEVFTEENAPKWLTSENTVPGSTMDSRWFWDNYVLTLDIGSTIETDFSVIKRIS